MDCCRTNRVAHCRGSQSHLSVGSRSSLIGRVPSGVRTVRCRIRTRSPGQANRLSIARGKARYICADQCSGGDAAGLVLGRGQVRTGPDTRRRITFHGWWMRQIEARLAVADPGTSADKLNSRNDERTKSKSMAARPLIRFDVNENASRSWSDRTDFRAYLWPKGMPCACGSPTSSRISLR
jgi:hypothetical protein